MSSYGFIRVASAVPFVKVGDTKYNIQEIKGLLAEANSRSVDLAVFPELSLCGYTCADLFSQHILIDSCLAALEDLRQFSLSIPGTRFAVGLATRYHGNLYNSAALVGDGKIWGIVPKTYLPSYNEFYEKRWFRSGIDIPAEASLEIMGEKIPFGTNILFRMGDATVGIEICEDLWAPMTPSAQAALQGADILLNLSASNELTGKHDYLISLIKGQSASLHAAYVYAGAGPGESSTDTLYAGNAVIAENGRLLCEGKRFSDNTLLEVADIDLEVLAHDRQSNTSFADAKSMHRSAQYRSINIPYTERPEPTEVYRAIESAPFVPDNINKRRERCEEIINIQTGGLIQRLRATRCTSLVLGISGGLDSTLALLIANRAFSKMGLPAEGIVAVTMPGFGTSKRTYDNSVALVRCLGATFKEISIAAAVRRHFEDIGHDEEIRDVTYENSQARERTQILMDLANKYDAMVLGTGDMSELALGWCTYNGDHMSMYGVNSAVPKTLVKYLVDYFADTTLDPVLHDVLKDIIDTPISPELIPADNDGSIHQKTEDLVGPYLLHDFFLYNFLRYGFSPRKIYFLAGLAFAGQYDGSTILHWLKTFIRRFFNQQFKRSCMPDGPKVGSICLSPRGDWRMPSDASAALWLAECDDIVP